MVKHIYSAGYILASPKATHKAICLSYIVEIAGHCIFSMSETTLALSKLRDAGVCEFHIAFALKPQLKTIHKGDNDTNKIVLFAPNTKWIGDKFPTNELNCVCIISSLTPSSYLPSKMMPM